MPQPPSRAARHATLITVGLLALVALAGCSNPREYSGDYAYFDWNTSTKQCVNGRCTYGSNQFSDSASVFCKANPTLSWDANSWIYGSVLLEVFGPDGSLLADHRLSSDGKGNEQVPGPAGEWTLKGTTNNANGNMQGRLTCP